MHKLYGGFRLRRAGVACSLHSTQDNLSGSRFRAVQCYNDPTMAVVADLTRSDMGGAQVQSLTPKPLKHFGPLKGGVGEGGGHQPLPRAGAELGGQDLQ